MADRSEIASLDAWCAKLSVLREKATRYDDRLLLYLLDMAILQVERKLAEAPPRAVPTNPFQAPSYFRHFRERAGVVATQKEETK